MVLNLGWQGWDKSDENDKDDKGNGKHETKAETREADEILEAGETDSAYTIYETQVLPAVKQGESGMVQVSMTEKTTQPPKPYTYHGLFAAMNNIYLYVKDPEIRTKLKEVQGIGTEATQEGIISTLFNRGYLEKKKKRIVSTGLGNLLIGMLLEGKGSVLVHADMTALWEKRMGEIEGESVSLNDFVSDVADMVREIISDRLNIPNDIPGMERRKTFEGEIVEAPCPLSCGKNAQRFVGKYGAFWKCSCSPDLTFRDVDDAPAVREIRTESKCPVKGCSGKAIRLVSKKDNRPFWKCNKCSNFFDDADGQQEIREKRNKNNK